MWHPILALLSIVSSVSATGPFYIRKEATMRFSLNNVLTMVLITIAGVSGSAVFGLMTYGGDLFSTTSPGFSFLAYGLSGAFIFSFYHVRGLSETITTAVVVSTVQFVLSLKWISVLSAGIWSFGVNLPVVVLAFIFERKLTPIKRARFVVVAAVYGAMFVLLSLVNGWLAGVEQMPAMVFRQNFIDGVLIGLGLGLGVQAGEALVQSIMLHRKTGPVRP